MPRRHRGCQSSGFRQNAPTITERIKELTFAVPVTEDGEFDLEAQRALASRYDTIEQTLTEAQQAPAGITGLAPDVMLPEDSSEPAPET